MNTISIYLLRTLGGFFLALPFIPIQKLLKGEKIDSLFKVSNSPFGWMLSSLTMILITWIVHWFVINFNKRNFFSNINLKIGNWKFNNISSFLTLVTFIALTVSTITIIAYHCKPHLIDNLVQLFQAKIFASGSIVSTKPELFEFFSTQHMLSSAGTWSAQYPPGWSLILSVGYLFNAPWIIPIFLTIASGILIFLFTKIIFNTKYAITSLLVLAFCPFFLFIGGTFSNHVPTLFFISLFAYFLVRWEIVEKKNYFLYIAAFSISYAFICRPLTTLAVALFLGISVLKRLILNKRIALLLKCAIFFSLPIIISLIYNTHSTGSALTSGYVALWGDSHNPGFHLSPWGFAHTPLRGINFQISNLYLLNEFLFESSIPSLWILGLFLLLSNSFTKWDKKLLLGFFTIPFAYIFYWHNDAFWGPRYIYSSLIFLIPLLGRAIYMFLYENNWKLSNLSLRFFNLKIFLSCLILITFGSTILEGFPRRFGIYKNRIKSWKIDLNDILKAQNIEEGLIFIPVSWGNRIISNLRGYGVSASLVEKAYRAVDHCILDALSKSAIENNVPIERVNKELKSLIKQKMTLIETNELNTDSTLKIRPNLKMADNCVDEVTYDRENDFLNFSPFLIYNEPNLNGKIVVARDLRKRNKELKAKYVTKKSYLLRKNKKSKFGYLLEAS